MEEQKRFLLSLSTLRRGAKIFTPNLSSQIGERRPTPFGITTFTTYMLVALDTWQAPPARTEQLKQIR